MRLAPIERVLTNEGMQRADDEVMAMGLEEIEMKIAEIHRRNGAMARNGRLPLDLTWELLSILEIEEQYKLMQREKGE